MFSHEKVARVLLSNWFCFPHHLDIFCVTDTTCLFITPIGVVLHV